MAHPTITKLYDTFAEARAVVADLEGAGIPHSHISIVANNAEEVDLDKNEKIARDAGIGATAGVIGAMTESGIDHDEAHVYAEGIRRGGALVSVRTDDKWIGLAREIMNRRPAVDPALRGEAYRAAGWSAFDATTTPYTPAQIE